MRTVLFVLFASMALAACDTEDPTTAVVDDEYPARVVVYRAWWSTTLFQSPIAAGHESQSERTVPASDYAYALLAPDWDPSSPSPPTTLIAVRSAAKLTVARGDVLHIHVSDATFLGDCAAGKPLTQDDADFITTRIFPGEFAGMTYDATTCTMAPIGDGGVDAASD